MGLPIADGRGILVQLPAAFQLQLCIALLLALLGPLLAVVGGQVDHLGLVDLQLLRKLLRQDLIVPVA